MAVQTITTASDIPKVLEKFYSEPKTGLLPRGISEIFPEGLIGADAYAQRFQPLIEQGLVGAGTVAPMSQFQQALGTQLAGMTMPDQFALAEQTGQAGAAGLQALLGVQAPTVSANSLSTFSMDPARQFSSAEAEAYMSPYFQNVVDAQQRASY
jgi:hypothetical protein